MPVGAADFAICGKKVTGLRIASEPQMPLTVDSDPQDFIRQDLVSVIRVGVNYRFGGP
jgi:hypothetical protein